MSASLSSLQTHRLAYALKLPRKLRSLLSLHPIVANHFNGEKQRSFVKEFFPFTAEQAFFEFEEGLKVEGKSLRVGVIFSGGQAPGGHNVIAGLFDSLKKFHPKASLIGFLGGPGGLIKNQSIALEKELIDLYRNQGGFDLLGSGRTKIETLDQLEAVEKTVDFHQLNGVVIIGGDDSNTNTALLAEHFKKKEKNICFIGVPKTIDGDLKNEFIEISFGFDTACKIYSENIGNILKDAISAKKYYFFIKLMGRSASHIALECSLKTHPNAVLIGEEIEQRQLSLNSIVQELVSMILARSEQEKDYGVVLIPEGLIEFIPEMKLTIMEINSLVAAHPSLADMLNKDPVKVANEWMTTEAARCFLSLPLHFQRQLLLDRDPHGNVQVSKIETERLLISMVEDRLHLLNASGQYKGKFNAQPLFFGYEGRSGLPSNFDCQYCYALGAQSALLIHSGLTGYTCAIKNLVQPVEEWDLLAVPICSMLHLENRNGVEKAVIKKSLVDIEGAPFYELALHRHQWMISDEYVCPGPMQFEGPSDLIDQPAMTLLLESRALNHHR